MIAWVKDIKGGPVYKRTNVLDHIANDTIGLARAVVLLCFTICVDLECAERDQMGKCELEEGLTGIHRCPWPDTSPPGQHSQQKQERCSFP